MILLAICLCSLDSRSQSLLPWAVFHPLGDLLLRVFLTISFTARARVRSSCPGRDLILLSLLQLTPYILIIYAGVWHRRLGSNYLIVHPSFTNLITYYLISSKLLFCASTISSLGWWQCFLVGAILKFKGDIPMLRIELVT